MGESHTFAYPDLSPTIPPHPTGTGEEGLGGQTETMFNPLWSGLELVMADTSAEVLLPPDHETRLGSLLNLMKTVPNPTPKFDSSRFQMTSKQLSGYVFMVQSATSNLTEKFESNSMMLQGERDHVVDC
ncbi:unnamed protein product [Brassica oleracea]